MFLVPLGLAVALDRVSPWHLPRPWLSPWLTGLLAGLLVAAGLGLMAWAFLTMRAARTTVVPWHRVDALVERGPFGLTRNPIYLGDLLVYLGLTLWAGSWWPLVVLPVVLVVMHRFVIAREEAYLGEVFGAEYLDYRRRVRRWL